MRRAGVTFLDAFLGSAVTLASASHLADVNLEGDVLPDARVLAQIVVSSVIAGMVALISYARTALAQEAMS